MSWSPSGLAKYGRCALAILTSNLLLCIWDPQTDPADPKAWRRTSIINDALSNHYLNLRVKRPKMVSNSTLRKRKRIRGFSWAPALLDPPFSRTGFPNSYYLAIVNDLLELFLVHVKTTCDSQIADSVANSDGPAVPLNISSPANSNGLLPIVRWSMWRLEEPLIHNTINLDINGSQCSLSILAKRNAESNFSFIAQKSEGLQSSYSTAGKCPWATAIEDTVLDPKGCLGNRVSEHKQQFSAQYNLDGRVTYRIWGISEYREYSTVCFTLHPSEMVQYVVPSTERSYLEFAYGSANGSSSEEPSISRFPWETIPTMKAVTDAHAMAWETLVEYVHLPGNDFTIP